LGHIYPPDYSAPPDYQLNESSGETSQIYPNMLQYDIPYYKNGPQMENKVESESADNSDNLKNHQDMQVQRQFPNQGGGTQYQNKNDFKTKDYYTQTGPGQYEPEEEPEIVKYMGIFPTIPVFNMLKILSLALLFVIVELNIYFNMNADLFIGDYLASDINILFGVGLIGVFLGFLFRYIKFEFARMNWNRIYQNKADLKNYLTIIFLIILFIFIYIEVIIELLSSRGPLLMIDMLSIHCMSFGTYTIFSGKRHINIFTMAFLFLIMLLGWDFHLDLPMVLLIGILTIVYLELSDGACKLQEYILKYHEIAEVSDFKQKTRERLDLHLNAFSTQFITNLGIFIGFTSLISILLLSIYYIYPFITPPFMAENIELQSVYVILPIITILFFIFLIVYLYSSRTTPTNKIIDQ
jgi:hypothetical protein